MAIKMAEKQMVHGKLVEYGTVISPGEAQENVLIAHGKAVKVEEIKPAYKPSKGDK